MEDATLVCVTKDTNFSMACHTDCGPFWDDDDDKDDDGK